MEQYYHNSSEKFFEKNFERRLKFIKDKKFLFSEISNLSITVLMTPKKFFYFAQEILL